MKGKAMNRLRYVLGLSCFMMLHVCDVSAQDLFMRRTNSVGNWKAQINNNGLLFNESDTTHFPPSGAGGLWFDPQNNLDTVVFGCGMWIGGLRKSGDTLAPHVEYSYDPNSATSVFVPGSVLGGG